MFTRRVFVLGLPFVAACRRHGVAAARQPLDVGLPFPAGVRGTCIQGPKGPLTHKGYFAWDFTVPWDTPVVAAARGQVVGLRDDSTATGANRYDDANRVLLDHGDGVFSSYLHHRTGTARVALGEVVERGAELALVGRSGTIDPHIHFDVRGPTYDQSYNLRFDTAEGRYRDVAPVHGYTSNTSASASAPAFSPSRCRGDEQAPNGLTFDGGQPAFLWRADEEIVFRGRAPSSERVTCYLWPAGHRSVFRARADVARGAFTLRVRVPAQHRGTFWWRLVAHRPGSPDPKAAAMPVAVV